MFWLQFRKWNNTHSTLSKRPTMFHIMELLYAECRLHSQLGSLFSFSLFLFQEVNCGGHWLLRPQRTSALCEFRWMTKPGATSVPAQSHPFTYLYLHQFDQESNTLYWLRLSVEYFLSLPICPLKVTTNLPSFQWSWGIVIAERDRKRHSVLALHLIFRTQWTCGESMALITALLYRPGCIGGIKNLTNMLLSCHKTQLI